ncbi:hypothetical protein [Dactylosporangium sp. NPDC048998]|uniref:hypothetical protein n=1 Tax=Dactylosporangium sp. NPDC048998 TaxID=3363976 RepID=UPI00371503E9
MDVRILEVARSIRPYLPELAGPAAADLDRALVALIRAAADGQDPTDRILALLASSPATHAWAAAVLADDEQLPPEVRQLRSRAAPPEGGYAALPNPHGGDVVLAQQYICPVDGAFAWWRISAGDPVRACPDHPDQPLRPV